MDEACSFVSATHTTLIIHRAINLLTWVESSERLRKKPPLAPLWAQRPSSTKTLVTPKVRQIQIYLTATYSQRDITWTSAL